MSTINIRDTLLQEVNTLSPVYYPDVLNFVETLKMKRQPAIPETMFLSESALSKDWESEEEEIAWASL